MRQRENQDFRLPTHVQFELLEHLPLRTCKIIASFRKKVLQDMHPNQRILNSLLLFHCQFCNERCVTYHPQHKQAFQLECLATYPFEVAQWDDEPSERLRFAQLHTGLCKRCINDAAKVQGDQLLSGIGVWSTENHMNLLHGLSLSGSEQDVKGLHNLFNEATVVEEMLVALNHMQVSVCTVGTGARRTDGMSNFRKNIISCHKNEMD